MKQMIMKWKDKRDLVLISKFHDHSIEDVTTGQGVIQKPSVIFDYNKNVGGLKGMMGNCKVTSWLENI